MIRIKKQVSGYLNLIRKPEQPYWEPFVGAAWILESVIGCGNKYASDANPYLVAMWKALQGGWVPPSTITESEYLVIKNTPDDHPPELVAFVGFGCSWGGKWFGGWGKVLGEF